MPIPPRKSPPLRRALLGFLAEAVVVAAVGLALCAQVFAPLRARPMTQVLGPLTDDFPSDLNGTVWFYGWMERAATHGLPILSPDWVSFPHGQHLREEFPNRVDAWMAVPFLHELPFPAGFNLFAACIPAFGTLGAYAFFRALTERRWLALSAALCFGFERYTFYELGGGRPVTALLMSLPLFLAAWWRALVAPSRSAGAAWALLAGVGACLVVRSYAPWALWVGALAAGWGAARLVAPASGVGRARPLVAATLALSCAAVLTAPYLHEVLVLRASDGAGGNPLWPWDPKVWTETLAALRRAPEIAGKHAAPFSAQSQNEVALDTLWSSAATGADRASLPGGTWVVVLAAAALGGWQARAWALAGFLAWCSLGGLYPVTQLTHSPAWLQAIGPWLPSPLTPVSHLAPGTLEHLRAYRGAPAGVLALLAAVVSAWEPLLVRTARWRATGLLLRLVGFGVVVALAWRTGVNAMSDAGRIPVTPWHPSPFFTRLAESPDSGAIIELPVGFGHAYGPFQLIHKHARSESAGDRLSNPLGHGMPVWLRGLDALGAPGHDPPDPAVFDEARESGFGWVVQYPRAYRRSATFGRGVDEATAEAWLTATLGPPAYSDGDVVAFKL